MTSSSGERSEVNAGRERARRRPVWRWAGRSGLLLIVLVGIFTVSYEAIFLRLVWPSLHPVVLEHVGFDVSLRGFRLSPTGAVHLSGVEARGGAGAGGLRSVSAENVTLRISLACLLKGDERWLTHVEVSEPQLEFDLSREPFLPEFLRGDEAVTPSPGDSPLHLPVIMLDRGTARVKTPDGSLHLHGVGLTSSPHRIRARVSEVVASGDFAALAALSLPIEAEARLERTEARLSEIVLERLTGGGEPMVESLRVVFPEVGPLRIEGSLGGTVAGAVVVVVEESEVTVDLAIERVALSALGAPIPALVGVEGTLEGEAQVVVGLTGEETWSLKGDFGVVDATWPAVELQAAAVDVSLDRPPGRPLRLELEASELSAPGGPSFDLLGRAVLSGLEVGVFQLCVEELHLETGDSTVSAAGALNLETNDFFGLTVELRQSSLAQLADWVPQLDGVDGGLEASANLRGNLRDLGATLGDLRAHARVVPATEEDEEEYVHAGLIAALGGCVVRSTLHVERHEGTFDFVSVTSLGWPLRVAVESLSASWEGHTLSALEQPYLLVDGGSTTPATWQVESGAIEVPGGELAIAAAGSREGEVDVWVRAPRFDLSALSLVLPDLELSGQGLGEAAWTLRPDQLPAPWVGEVSVTLSDVGIQLSSERLEGLKAEVRLRSDGNVLEIERLVASLAEHRLDVQGVVPWGAFADDDTVGMELSVEAHSPDVGRFSHWVAVPREISGAVVLKGRLWGSFPRPEVDAVLTVKDGTLKLHDYRTPVEELHAAVRVQNGALTIEELRATARGAPLQVDGRASIDYSWASFMAAPRLDLRDIAVRIRGDDILMLREQDLRLRGDVDVVWRGSVVESIVDGEVRLTRAYYFRDVPLTASRGAGAPLTLFSFDKPPFRNARLQVKLRSERGLVVSNNVISTRASADLEIGGTGFEPVVTGNVTTDEGRIRLGQFSQLKVQNANVQFVESEPLNPRLNIVLGRRFSNYDLVMTIGGTLNDPEVVLESSPPLESEEKLVLAATGMTVSQIERRGVDRVAAMEAAKYLGYRLASYFRTSDLTEETFVDRLSLEIESSDSNRYQDDSIRVEYRLLDEVLLKDDHIFLQGERDIYGDLNVNTGIRFEID